MRRSGSVRWWLPLAAAVAATLMTAGCGPGPLGAGDRATDPGAGQALSLAHRAASLEELAAEVGAVAVVTADDVRMVSATEDETSGLTAFAADVTVHDLMAGDLLDDVLLRIPEGDMIVTNDRVAPMEAGHTYLIFADPFWWRRGEPTGDWFVRALYEVDGDRLTLVPGAQADLPASTTLDEVTAATG